MRGAGAYDYLLKDMELEFLDRLPRIAHAAVDLAPRKAADVRLPAYLKRSTSNAGREST